MKKSKLIDDLYELHLIASDGHIINIYEAGAEMRAEQDLTWVRLKSGDDNARIEKVKIHGS